jgi:hypothetical protein
MTSAAPSAAPPSTSVDQWTPRYTRDTQTTIVARAAAVTTHARRPSGIPVTTSAAIMPYTAADAAACCEGNDGPRTASSQSDAGGLGRSTMSFIAAAEPHAAAHTTTSDTSADGEPRRRHSIAPTTTASGSNTTEEPSHVDRSNTAVAAGVRCAATHDVMPGSRRAASSFHTTSWSSAP